MDWRVVYDIGSAGSGDFTHWLYVGAGFLLLALVFHLWARRKGKKSATAKVVGAFGVIAAALGYGVNTWDQQRLAGHLGKGEVSQVEGSASEHQVWRQDITRPGESQRRYQNWETVVVGRIRFTWAPGADEPAFTNRGDPPLAIQDGMMMRIAYVEDVPDQPHQRRIVRLEVANAPVRAGPSATAPVRGGFRADQPVNGAPFPSTASPVGAQ